MIDWKSKYVKFTAYYDDYNDPGHPMPKFFIDWFFGSTEDYFFSCINGDDEISVYRRQKNLDRHKWYNCMINICGYQADLEIRKEHIGLLYYGKLRSNDGYSELINQIRKRNKK